MFLPLTSFFTASALSFFLASSGFPALKSILPLKKPWTTTTTSVRVCARANYLNVGVWWWGFPHSGHLPFHVTDRYFSWANVCNFLIFTHLLAICYQSLHNSNTSKFISLLKKKYKNRFISFHFDIYSLAICRSETSITNKLRKKLFLNLTP